MPIPDSAQSDPAAPDGRAGFLAIEALARAARQLALYGTDHPIAETAVREAWRELTAAAEHNGVELRVEEAGLRWNHDPAPIESSHLQRLHQSFRDRLVATIKFTRKLEASDLTRLLVVLTEDPQLLLSAGGVMQAVGPLSAEGLLIEDVDFDRDVRDCERAWIGVCPDLDPEVMDPLRGILESCLHLVRATGESRTLEQIRLAMSELAPADPSSPNSATETVAGSIAALLQAAGEIAVHTSSTNLQQWQIVVLQHLEALGSRWSAFIFRAPVQVSQDNADMLALLTRQMTFGARIALVLDYPGSIATERSEGLALLLERLFSDPEDAPALARALHDRAVAQGVPEELYRNVVGMLTPALGKQRRAGEVLRTERADAVPPDATPAFDFTDLLSSLASGRLRRSRAYLLLDMLNAHLIGNHYPVVVNSVLETLRAATQEGDAELLISLLEQLLKDAEEAGLPGSSRRAITENVLLGSVDVDTMALLLRELDGRSPEQRSGLLRLVGQLGNTGKEALLNWTQGIRNKDSGESLLALAETDVPPFQGLRQALVALPLIDLEQALHMLMVRLDPRLIGRLEVVASHSDPRARLCLVHVTDMLQHKSGSNLMARLLSDPVPDVRAAAATALGKLGSAEAVPTLCHLLERESEFGLGARVKEAAARALGEIASPEAVPALAQFLVSGGLLARFSPTEPRAAAVEALRRIGTSDAQRGLADWPRCRHPAVRKLCRKALTEIGRETVGPEAANADSG